MPTKVQSVTGVGSGATPLALTFAATVSSGNLIVVSVGYRQQDAGGITLAAADSAGNAYALSAAPSSTAAFAWDAAILYAKNVTGGIVTVTVTPSAAPSVWSAVATEYAGCDATPFDQARSAGNQFSASPSSGATGPLAAAGELVVGALMPGGSGRVVTDGAGFTRDAASGGSFPVYTEYLVAAGTAGVAATWTLDSATSCGAAVATFKSGSGGGSTVSGSGYSAGPSSAASVGLLRVSAGGRAIGAGSAASVGLLRLTGSGLSPGLSAAIGSPRIVSTGVGAASGRGVGEGVLPGGVTLTASGCSVGRGSAATPGLLRATASGVSVGRAATAGGGLLAVAAGGAAVSISVAAGVVPGPLGPGTRAGVWVVPGLARKWVVPAGGRTWEVPSQ